MIDDQLRPDSEIALDRFISGEISFIAMSSLVEKVLCLPEFIKYENTLLTSIDDIIALNNSVRHISYYLKP